MKRKKILIGVLLAAAILLAEFGIHWVIRQSRERKDEQVRKEQRKDELIPVDERTTLEKIAYDQTEKRASVYIKENGEYTPYLVVESDYGGNVLLLREYVIPNIQYKPYTYGETVEGLSGGWVDYYSYLRYYEESSIDKFLNSDFLELLSPQVQAAIVDSTIEVADMKSYDEEYGAEATHMIDRKVFLLSAVELGVTCDMSYCMTEEGTVLKYFEDTRYPVKNARAADGTGWPNWTRTPGSGHSYTITVICIDALGSARTDSKLGARPAFCMEKDTAIHLQDNILADKSVYVLDLESE